MLCHDWRACYTYLHPILWGIGCPFPPTSPSSTGRALWSCLSSPPAQQMVWLELMFDTVDMTITMPQEKLAEVDTLVHQWQKLAFTTHCPLHSILKKLFFVAQCCPPPTRFFLNRKLETLRACSAVGIVSLSPGFKKDLNWFSAYLVSHNGVHIIHHDNRTTMSLYVDACATGAGATCGFEALSHPVQPSVGG